MRIFDVLLVGSRPKTLAAGIAPVLVGYAVYLTGAAPALVDLMLLWQILLAALLIQITANFSNDLSDYLKGTDNNRIGPQRVLQSGMATVSEVKMILVALVVATILAGLPLVFKGGLPILVIGLVSILFAFLYTAGPWPLGYLGLGEIFVIIFFGIVPVAGTEFLFSGNFNPFALLAGLAAGTISAGILIVNNIRDIEGDSVAGKNTLAVRFGREFSRRLYASFLLLPQFIAVLFAICFGWVFLAALLYLFPASSNVLKLYKAANPDDYNKLLAGTGRTLIVFSVLLLVSALSMWIR